MSHGQGVPATRQTERRIAMVSSREMWGICLIVAVFVGYHAAKNTDGTKILDIQYPHDEDWGSEL